MVRPVLGAVLPNKQRVAGLPGVFSVCEVNPVTVSSTALIGRLLRSPGIE